MGVIFWLSSRTADQSSLQSGAILQWLTRIFGTGFFTDFIVRKSAHCLEYTGLCLLFNIALFQTKKKRMPILSTVFSSLYAVTDEIHQHFIEGRSCQISDWAIDTLGAVLGAIAFLILFAVIRKHITKKSKFVDSKDN